MQCGLHGPCNVIRSGCGLAKQILIRKPTIEKTFNWFDMQTSPGSVVESVLYLSGIIFDLFLTSQSSFLGALGVHFGTLSSHVNFLDLPGVILELGGSFL